MAITYRTLTGDLTDLLGVDLTPAQLAAARIVVRTNLLPGTVPLDKTTGKLLLGSAIVTKNTDGTFSISNLIDWATSAADINPTGIQYQVDIYYIDPGANGGLGGRGEWHSGWLQVTTSGLLTSVVATQLQPPNYALDGSVAAYLASTSSATYAALLTILNAGWQPLDADLTAIAALTTTPFGRGLLALADANAGRTTLGLGSAAVATLDTNTALGTSNTAVPSQAAVKAYTDAIIGAQDAMVFKGTIDASTNPNYPAGNRGDTYRFSVAGKIGGAAGPNVEAGDILLCLTDGTATGNHATVGNNWTIIQTNIDGAVVGPTTSTSGNLATFNGATGKVIADSGIAIDTDGALAANSDQRVATQKAVKAYVDVLTAGAPATLNNFLEVATALGSDPAFSTNVYNAIGARIAAALVDAKGDLIAATANDAPARLAVGTDRQSLIADSTAATGLRWAYANETATRTTSTTLAASSPPLNLVDATTGAVGITLPTGTSGMTFTVKKTDSTTNTVTITVTSAGTIDGALQVVLTGAGDSVTLTCSAAGAWQVVAFAGSRSRVTVMTASGTFVKDARSQIIEVEGLAGGNGGGSGAVVASGTACSGGAAGPGGAGFLRRMPGSVVAASVPCTVGAGGAGGAAVSTASTAGNDGGKGGTTQFGTNSTDYLAFAAANTTANRGGQIGGNASGTTNIGQFLSAASAQGNLSGAGSAAANASGLSAPGGGSGGGLTSAPAATAGGAGIASWGFNGSTPGGGAAPGGAGSTGGDAPTLSLGTVVYGASGGGGASSTTGNGGAGGNGGRYGAGGGGGGSCLNGFTSGKGGDGAQGILIIREWF